ncbi:CoA-binding protein [Pseudoflavitalea sp. G-6-1-2]|uniref:CoA-binding protein n=1 Tax=Pseudoflavitalea sp. G-6-1-2 TaxID=2728841 RepID=UPI00146A76A6|nr:CoA-binding protein [Pseudoflavitalea sp. G-6-1-2]NML20632.1 CoA-binding protein [Pseudoflavitalea sp. G-6-1-2]
MKTPKKTLVIGASNNPERYSYLAVNRLRSAGHPVVAIGLKPVTVADVEVETEQKPFEGVDTVTLYLNPTRQKDYYDYILSLHPSRIIFNPGAENEELAELAKQNGIQTMEACTLVLLSTGQF